MGKVSQNPHNRFCPFAYFCRMNKIRFFHNTLRRSSIVLCLSVLSALGCHAQIEAALIPKRGLFLESYGLTWASGSELSFFTPDKQRHHYYFTWWEQDVDSTRKDAQRLIIGSENTAVFGAYTLRQSGDVPITSIDCRWNLEESAVADIVHARLWAPYFTEARWSIGTDSLAPDALESFHDTLLIASTPFGTFRFIASHPFRIQRQETPNPQRNQYSNRDQYLIFSERDIPISRGGRLERWFRIEPVSTLWPSVPKETAATRKVNPAVLTAAWQPRDTREPILPTPARMELHQTYYRIPFAANMQPSDIVTRFREILSGTWQLSDNWWPQINHQKDKKLPEEGYALEIQSDGIQIRHSSAAGLEYALQTLAQLTRVDSGRLIIPQGIIEDYPKIAWRGIHMFTGPQSWPLHRKMYENILLPLKMNRVVLQCEQAEWKSHPLLHNPISVPLADLKAEFDYLRRNHIEPIPLIQSLGHMEWFFKPPSYRFMAVNPDYPYTLNPELPEARLALRKIWDETFELLKPRIMHIGFDEIGMIGFHLPREKEIDFWTQQIKYLHEYARKRKAKLMLWGDMGLAPGEGPDALNGKTPERAAFLRSTIPNGSFVADWHYLGEADPEPYRKSLRIWKENRNIPLASPWFLPENIYGFVHAAIRENAGLLQTTWADFESSERNMLLNIEQFGAYILALDYAWSGRQTLPENLPYHAIETWSSRFYRQPKPLTALHGHTIAEGFSFRDLTLEEDQTLPSSAVWTFPVFSAKGLHLEAKTAHILPEATPVARISASRANKTVFEYTIRYGAEIRAAHDERAIHSHIPEMDIKTLIRFLDEEAQIDTLEIVQLHPAAGLSINSLVLFSSSRNE